MRIISTVPSQTELLADLGLENEVVGITKFCIHPNEWYRNKIRIGGTKTLNVDKIRSLEPTLVIANKEENTKEQIEEIMTFCEVYVSEIKTPEDNVELIHKIGELTDTRMTAVRLARELENCLMELENSYQATAAYMIWKDPWMSTGGDTYIHSIMKKCGFQNVFSHKNRYPETTLEELTQLGPDMILLSSEPFPFKEKHLLELRDQLPASKVLLVDGEAFSWYGTRLIKKIDYLKSLITNVTC